MKTRGGDTKAEIREQALTQFGQRGYHGSSLEDIGQTLGITRSAILFHFGTKAELLAELLEPFEHDLDDVLERYPGATALTPSRRRHLLADLIACCLRHRGAAALLVGSGAGHLPEDVEERTSRRLARCSLLLAGPHPTAHDKVVLSAITGVIRGGLIDSQPGVCDTWTQSLILDATLYLVRRLGNEPQPPAAEAGGA